jgi:HD-GYP domain-containing protein (c-di-GMP phosphodiesterase class II)
MCVAEPQARSFKALADSPIAIVPVHVVFRAVPGMVLNPLDRQEQPVDVWTGLNHFVERLHGAGKNVNPFSLLLEAVAESLGTADAVFLCGDVPESPARPAGRIRVDDAWCRDFARLMLAGRLQGGAQSLVRQLPTIGTGRPQPTSAAMVQLSRSRNAWLVAASFGAEPLRESDLQTMILAHRIFCLHLQQLFISDDLKDTVFGLIYCLTASIDAKDPYTSGHSERVGRMAVELARQMGLSEAEVNDIYLAGLLHDIGKIGIRDRVLQKPGRLTDEEMRHVQEHPVIGDRMLSKVRRLAHLRPGVRNHHERYDGNGYPDRLSGEAIPLVARILAVADSCDAMMSPRPYRKAVPRENIEHILQAGAGTQWDPRLVAHFMACRSSLYSIGLRTISDTLYTAVQNALRPVLLDSADFGTAVRGRV